MSRTPRAGGFTLIELMIVISILALLFTVLAPSIWGAQTSALEAETEAIFLRLDTAAKKFKDNAGYYPPADLRVRTGAQPGWKPDNGTNTPIESFVVFVNWQQKGGTDLSDIAAKLSNTDGDQNGAELLFLQRTDRPEVCDAWGTPLAYFTKFTMDQAQNVMDPEGKVHKVKARKDERGNYLGGRTFQFVSAGKDKEFDTEDDLTWPKN